MLHPSEVGHLKTDLFRDRFPSNPEVTRALAAARRLGPEAVRAARRVLGPVDEMAPGPAVDLLLSFRATEAWEDMLDVIGAMAAPLQDTVLVREQLGFALNRVGRSREAEIVLRRVLDEHGPDSETLGLLGRVYKDRWRRAVADGDHIAARHHLRNAIEAYVSGFAADPRDVYPGVNALTLMELAGRQDANRDQLLAAVRTSGRRRLGAETVNYWDHAALLEIEVLAGDQATARDQCRHAAAAAEEAWQLQTTIDNLRLIHRARGDQWLADLLAELERSAEELRR